ncbi:MAG: hypothetical protein H7328_02660, partial [Bdellovibrio sp.]|nr:hypothetical protein [Bdellovibrio sp.]
MKILLVDMQYDYGQKSRGLNHIGEIGFRIPLVTLGHEVIPFYYDDYLKNTEALQGALLKKADEVQPDLIYFILFAEQFKIETLLQLKSKYKTINWFGDDQWRFKSFTTKYAPCFTYCVTTDPFSVGKYHRLGIQNIFLSQWAALNLPVQPLENTYKYDVSFIGGSHSVRRWFIHMLRNKGLKVNSFGHGWPEGPVELDQMVQIFRQSKINLNIG